MKKTGLILLILLALGALIGAWLLFGSATGFEGEKETLYIRSNAATKEAVLDSLEKNKIIVHRSVFKWLANRLKYWENIKPGKYEIKNGSSALTILRLLKNGRQTPVNLVITKLRTREDLARLVGRKFECDSQQMIRFLTSTDSLKSFDADTTTSMWLVLPDTYTFFWNTTPTAIYRKFKDASNKFWTTDRKKQAEGQGITPVQAFILASIVEEETNNQAEKGSISSVYLNRLHKGMPLQADPTIKFALNDFSLRRIYEKYLRVPSPFNTYLNKGLPPGPICTPSKKTIDAVLTAPQTDYLYFVANSSFNGTHVFSATYEEHMKNAHAYQQALDSVLKAKASRP
jgi:UPF0755 protein